MPDNKSSYTNTNVTIMKEGYNPKVSVIIPVWNPGPGISRCIESLRNQTLNDIEMIFVDDCGTDNSMDKVHSAAKKDSRIRIIENEENFGAGPSRNRGIEAARGEYLSFVDPDDYVSPDFLELLYTEAARGSFCIIKGSTIREKEVGTVANTNRIPNQIIRESISRGNALYTVFTSEHQTAIYRRVFLLKNNIRYGTSSRAQDTVFLLQACYHADSFSTEDGACYHYCERSSAAMNTMDADMIQGFLQAVKEQVNYIINSIPEGNDSRLLMKYLFLRALGEYLRYDDILEMKSHANNYLLELRLLLHLPFNEDFVNSSPSLRFLKKYGIGLPLVPNYSPWEGSLPPLRYAKLTERWVNFYLNHPTEKEACQKPLILVFTKAWQAIKYQSTTDYSPEEYRLGKKLLKKQIKRVSFLLRVRIKHSIAPKNRLGFYPSHE